MSRLSPVQPPAGSKGLQSPLSLVSNRLPVSGLVREYEKAFTEASGLPLELDGGGGPTGMRTCGNPFCELMARVNPTCKECLSTQAKLRKLAQSGTRSVNCFAGLCETAVPVGTEDGSPAFFTTGHVFLAPPDAKRFEKVAAHLLKCGVKVNLKDARKAWLSGRVMPVKTYNAFVRLIEMFAMHLQSCGVSRPPQAPDPNRLSPVMSKAMSYIVAHSSEELSLKHVAQMVNLSPNHFCRRFKEATSLSFTEFLNKTRLESAKQKLRNDPSARVGEVAFSAGFQSISRFNRVFRQKVGLSPTEYRDQSPGDSGSASLLA